MVLQFDFRHGVTPTLFIDPDSLGYTVQGLSILDGYSHRGETGLVVETDPRLLPLFQRSYHQTEFVQFVALDKEGRAPAPKNETRTIETLSQYFKTNAARLAASYDIANYRWSTLLRLEIAAPYNEFSPAAYVIFKPRPNYLIPDETEVEAWTGYLSQDDRTPVLVTWNKGFSQHGNDVEQNLDAADINKIIKGLSRSTSKLVFYNAMHGITRDQYAEVNEGLSEKDQLQPIHDPKTGKDFELGTELDRFTAFMAAAKNKGGIMLGVGNSYQHMWYGARPDAGRPAPDQLVVLPNGKASVKPAWELQAAQPGSPTIAISKYSDFAKNRTDTLLNIVAQTRRTLKL